MNKKTVIKKKFYNHLTKNGEKHVTEKIIFKTIKELQKNSKKKSTQLITTSVFLAAPSFRIFSFRTKKRKKKKTIQTPVFIKHKTTQISFAIKLILKAIGKNFYLFQGLKNEFLFGSNNSSKFLKLKTELHECAIKKKNILTYYKW